jgi:hypothetical protein
MSHFHRDLVERQRDLVREVSIDLEDCATTRNYENYQMKTGVSHN